MWTWSVLEDLARLRARDVLDSLVLDCSDIRSKNGARKMILFGHLLLGAKEVPRAQLIALLDPRWLLALSQNGYGYIYIYMYIRRPLPERERASLHCYQPIPSNPADSNQPVLQYLAISHPEDCNLPILQSAACLIAPS